MRQRVYLEQAKNFRHPLSLVLGGMAGAAFVLGMSAHLVMEASDRSISRPPCMGQRQFVATALRTISGKRSACEASPSAKPLTSPPLQSAAVAEQSLDFFAIARDYDQLRYTVTAQPPFSSNPLPSQSPSLDEIIAGILDLVEQQSHPTAAVSISLVDLTGRCCDYGKISSADIRPVWSNCFG